VKTKFFIDALGRTGWVGLPLNLSIHFTALCELGPSLSVLETKNCDFIKADPGLRGCVAQRDIIEALGVFLAEEGLSAGVFTNPVMLVRELEGRFRDEAL